MFGQAPRRRFQISMGSNSVYRVEIHLFVVFWLTILSCAIAMLEHADSFPTTSFRMPKFKHPPCLNTHWTLTSLLLIPVQVLGTSPVKYTVMLVRNCTLEKSGKNSGTHFSVQAPARNSRLRHKLWKKTCPLGWICRTGRCLCIDSTLPPTKRKL